MKFAATGELQPSDIICKKRRNKLTIGGSVHDDEAGIDSRRVLTVDKINGISMTAKPFSGLEDINIMRTTVERPQSSNAGTTAANDGNLLPGDTVNRLAHQMALIYIMGKEGLLNESREKL